MTDEEAAARLDRLEQRMVKLEATIYAFQATVAKKLTQALTLLQGRQQAREKKVTDSLAKLAGELSQLRDKLGAGTKPPKVTH